MIADPKWDTWRATYATMTDRDQKLAHAYFWKKYASTNHSFNVPAMINFLRTHRWHSKRVLEIGGGDGSLAARMLPLFDEIDSWVNIEFCNEAAAAYTPHPRYSPMVPPTFRWWKDGTKFRCDVLILSHVLEHLSPEDIKGMLGAIDAHYMYIDVPLMADQQTDWTGTGCTHVLTMSAKELVTFIESLGWHCTFTDQYAPAGHVSHYHKEDRK